METTTTMPLPHVLDILIWLPIIGAALVLALGRRAQAARWLALIVTLATFVISVLLWKAYVPAVSGIQFIESHPWIDALR
ncbi:MAG: hypothetical protein WBW61_11795, partial [Rhodanobacteraceae bacterium]